LEEPALEIGSWWSRRHDVEIDIAGIDNNEYLLLGSCKWSRSKTGVGALNELVLAQERLGPRAAGAKLLIFSRGGFSKDLDRRTKLENVHLVETEDLFAD